MTSVVLPFLMSMLLGRSIDLRTYSISGVNVYDDAEYVDVPKKSLKTTYNVLQDETLPYGFFGVPIDIVLRIKANVLSSSSGAIGLDGVLRENSWKYHSAIVSVTTVYQTVERSLKPYLPALNGWYNRVAKSQTHYAKTLYYGGWNVVLLRLKCDIASDVTAVRKVLTKHLGPVGTLTIDSLSHWENAIAEIRNDTDIRGRVDFDTVSYSSVPTTHTVESAEGLLDVIQYFPDNVGKLGIPLYMKLEPLHPMNHSYSEVTENKILGEQLEKLDDMYDDVRLTKVKLMRWIEETMTSFPPEDEDKVSQLMQALNDCIREFSNIIADVSIYKDLERSVLENAFQKYSAILDRGITTYEMAYRRLKEKIDAHCENTFLHKIRGLLRVYEDEVVVKDGVKVANLQECQQLCTSDSKCRSIGYAPHASELDMESGLYYKKEKQCWIYYRSTSTAAVHTPNGLSGDLGVYDRVCY